MSILIHFCKACDHQEIQHQFAIGRDSYVRCACCNSGEAELSESTLVETFSMDGRPLAERVEPLMRPGEVWNAGTVHKQQLCDCERCRARYAELAG